MEPKKDRQHFKNMIETVICFALKSIGFWKTNEGEE